MVIVNYKNINHILDAIINNIINIHIKIIGKNTINQDILNILKAFNINNTNVIVPINPKLILIFIFEIF